MTLMSNAEIARGLYAAFVRRDIPAILALLTDDVEWGEPENPYNPAAGTRHGHSGFLEWLAIGRDAEDITADAADHCGALISRRARSLTRSIGLPIAGARSAPPSGSALRAGNRGFRSYRRLHD
jgi:SnoaL-like domain